MWRADADPCVLSVTAVAASSPDAVDLRCFDHRILAGAEGEYVRVIAGGEVFRLDVMSGSVMAGPVRLTYLLARGHRLNRQMETIRLFEHCHAGSEPRQASGARFARAAMALRAHDARAAGASLRDIAAGLLGPGEWPGPGEYRKSAARRLVAMGKKMVREGPLPVLAV